VQEDLRAKKKAPDELKKASDEWWEAEGHRGDFIWNLVHIFIFCVAIFLFVYGIFA
jgi:hypothetical protein